MIIEKAYAKINLALEVKNKRSDGFHEVDTLMIPIDVYDTLKFEIIDSGIVIEPDFLNIKLEDNFIYKAAKLFLEEFNIKFGVKVTIDKKIPAQAGLAGGSADAAATLRGLKRLFGVSTTFDELLVLGSKLGSDMPYCIHQKFSRCTGRGEIVSLINTNYKKIPITIVKPQYGLSTKLIYDNYTYNPLNRENNLNNLIIGLKNNNIDLVKGNIFNDLLSASIKVSDDFFKLYTDLNKNDSYFMSGSGPTLYSFGHHDLTEKYLKDNDLLLIHTYII